MVVGLTLPTEDRILLYLSNFKSLEDVYECDSNLTQKGIAVHVRVQRKHISRYLDNLINEGFVEEQVRHVKGAKQKMNCYSLSGVGLNRAREIERSVGEQHVKVRINGKIREMKISEIDSATSVHLRISDIVCEALESNDVLEMGTLESIEEERRRLLDEKSMKAEVYRKALAVAWRSGILTSSEKHLIDALKTHLGISDKQHRSMETIIINGIPKDKQTRAEIYDEVLNLIDGTPTPREEMILELLKERLPKE